jgi:hypothetical protein
MQPDSIRPAAKIPSFTFSDDTFSDGIFAFPIENRSNQKPGIRAHNLPALQTPRFH